MQPVHKPVGNFMQRQVQNGLKTSAAHHFFHGNAAGAVLMKRNDFEPFLF